MRFRCAIFIAIYALTTSHVALACGPFFPYAYLAFGREHDVLKLPEASFYNELCRVMNVDPMANDSYYDPSSQQANSLAADAQSLTDALKAAGMSDDAATEIVGKYRVSREPKASRRSVPSDQIPREFTLYAEGASLYWAGDFDQAVAKWKELLALPAEQRKYKSVWAAYMIGRALRDTDAAQANAAFEQARALASEGYPDPLALAGESYGWQGYVANNAGDIAAAVENYAKQFAHGGANAASASASLHMICSRAFDTPEALAACATNQIASAVLTAWVISHPGYSQGETWSALLANANAVDLPQADLLAWIAYNAADFDSARKLLDAKSAETPYGDWVRSKLLLRDGKVDDALALMKQISPEVMASIPLREYAGYYYGDAPPMTSIDGEIGVLLLGKNQYAESFERFINAGMWLDAAYVGERVMTTGELKAYITGHENDAALNETLGDGYYYLNAWEPEQDQTTPKSPTYLDLTRYILARRLARANQWAEAQPYWPAPIAERAAQLVALRSEGKADQPPVTKQSTLAWFLGSTPNVVIDRDRAKKLFDAAVFTRKNGMQLLGTEVQPDWHVFGGWFELPGYYGSRARWEGPHAPKYSDETAPAAEPENLPEELDRALSASDDELRRLRESAPTPNQRFHYRYTAADLMWQAAQNLPDNDIDTMRALYTGGTYLKGRDPKAANRFYRSLIWRNPNMPYAQNADKLRWFPESPPE